MAKSFIDKEIDKDLRFGQLFATWMFQQAKDALGIELSDRAKKESVAAGKFLAAFIAVFGIISIALNFVPLELIERPVAEITLAFLQGQGFSGSIVSGNPDVLIQLDNGLQVVISYLCTGLLEMTVLVSTIIASLGIDWRKRILGIIAGIIGTIFFNFFRIFATLSLIIGNADIQVISFAHDALFRATLFIVIVGIYAAWFYWATRK